MIGAIIQARMSSTRLPGKMAKNVQGRTLLEWVILRAKKIKNVDKVVLATTVKKDDDVLEGIAKQNRILVFRGSDDDVLDRFYQTAKRFNLNSIVRITGDCPVLDVKIAQVVIDFYLKNRKKFDYVSNSHPPTFPDGLDVEVFSFAALEKSWHKAKLKSEREHVTPYIVNHPEIFRIYNVYKKGKDLSALRLTLDEQNDLILIRKIYRALCPKKEFFGLKEIVGLLNKKPELLKINQGIQRNEGLLKSMQQDQEYGAKQRN